MCLTRSYFEPIYHEVLWRNCSENGDQQRILQLECHRPHSVNCSICLSGSINLRSLNVCQFVHIIVISIRDALIFKRCAAYFFCISNQMSDDFPSPNNYHNSQHQKHTEYCVVFRFLFDANKNNVLTSLFHST